ncbi:hypothetical protein GCM10011416_08360 [Polaribacter pacificus]|uniref:Uncharacterized protein n=1 Tax=Polaribacter pacificus TaxID=1775173 RepID=A0A917HW69_9FLAO|nr:hypothetical protein [Polaribacter pacificus]GGG93540.1 hypothetical protein GCM10011416_08360 [Polaribacter pacificus]
MTDTLISMISIFIGILGANLMGFGYKKYSLGFTGNTITGIFGSIFFIKSFGRFGFDPRSIMITGEIHSLLFTTNLLVSFLGGAIGLCFVKWLVNKIQ